MIHTSVRGSQTAAQQRQKKVKMRVILLKMKTSAVQKKKQPGNESEDKETQKKGEVVE